MTPDIYFRVMADRVEMTYEVDGKMFGGAIETARVSPGRAIATLLKVAQVSVAHLEQEPNE